MPNPADDRGVRKRMERIEFLLKETEESADPQILARTREIVQGVLDLHGAALERILETVAASGEVGMALIDALARDNLVSSVLLLYGLHPLDLETRARQALETVRPQLRSHGGEVELLGVADGAVRLRIRSSGNGCHSSVQSLQQVVEDALCDKAPDATTIEVEAVEAPAGPAAVFIPVEELVRRN